MASVAGANGKAAKGADISSEDDWDSCPDLVDDEEALPTLPELNNSSARFEDVEAADSDKDDRDGEVASILKAV